MAAMDASPFANAAQKDGIVVSAEEIERKVGIYRKLYPGREVESDKVKKIALAEKYLEGKGMRPDGAEPDGVAENGFDTARSAGVERTDLENHTLRLHRLLARKDTQREAGKLEELHQLQLVSEYRPQAMWSQSDLQIKGDPEECLAWSGRSCLISLLEYNAATAYYPMPGGMPLDSGKAIIFKRYLSEKRMAQDARGKGLDRNADSLLPRIKGQKDDFRWVQTTRAFGIPVREKGLLEAAYVKYYRRYFAPGEDVTIAIIGSSDSAYIDSLYGAFRSWNRKSVAARKSGLPAPKEPRLPWSHFKEHQVSKDLAALTDSLETGQCSPPYRSPSGYFLVRLIRAVPTREVSLKEAYLRLVYLATRDKFLDMDSVVEAQARKYYAANLARFASPDTIALDAWLIPGPEPSPAAAAAHTGRIPVLADTARFKSMGLPSSALPSELRIALQERVKRDSVRRFFGPMPDRHGRWYFRVRSRKPAHGVTPFRLARKEILDLLTALPEEHGSGTASDEAQEEVGANLALAQALRQERFRKEQAETDGKSLPKDGADQSRPNGQSEAEQAKAIEAASARIRAEEAKRLSDEARMLKEARADLGRLFR